MNSKRSRCTAGQPSGRGESLRFRQSCCCRCSKRRAAAAALTCSSLEHTTNRLAKAEPAELIGACLRGEPAALSSLLGNEVMKHLVASAAAATMQPTNHREMERCVRSLDWARGETRPISPSFSTSSNLLLPHWLCRFGLFRMLASEQNCRFLSFFLH